MLLRRITEHVKAQNWTAVALDFVIVVVGVYLGIQVNNWNEARAEARREAVYLAALKEDFGQIIAELEADAREYETMANAMTFLLDQSRLPSPDATVTELNSAAARLISMEGTPIVDDTYTNLTGSGDLSIIKSQTLKNELASFYSYTAIIRLVSNTHEMQLVNIFQPYIINNLDYVLFLNQERGIPAPAAFAPKTILTALPTQEFRNVVAVKWDITTDIRNLHLDALVRARAVDARLSQEIEKNS